MKTDMENRTTTDTSTTITAAPADISLIRSGPFYRLQERLGLIHSGHWNPGRCVLIAIAVAWLPLVVIQLVLDPTHIVRLLGDYRVDSRFLVAVPILVLALPHMDGRFRGLLKHIRDMHLLDGPDLTKMNAILAGLERLGDSIWPELLILLAILTETAFAYKVSAGEVIGDLAYQNATGAHLTPAG
ncbi:MAG TPA: hypothetical protein VE779_16625, partial [Candidatus Angelobacter sp.]|nr:hypothetical protein [Candidatus Angelobacter sp.]